MKKAILSFDYELFFGKKSGTVLNSIVTPTKLLMDAMECSGFRGNFFVDYLMFKELEKLNDKRAATDLKMLKDQIHEIIQRGHRIELHLHPHWINAKYNGDGTWDFSDFTHYSLSSFNNDEIVDMFINGTNYLTSLAREIDPDYRMCAFRAGGWSVQPFEKIKDAFLKSGITIDSSAAFGMYNFLDNSSYDFRNIPRTETYKFNDDVSTAVADGPFLEVPITTFHLPSFLYFHDRRFWSKNRFRHYADGTHERVKQNSYVQQKRKSVFERIIDKIKPSKRNMLTFTYLSPFSLMYVRYFVGGNIHCYIDHPKDLTDATLLGIYGMKGKYENLMYIDLIKK